MGVGKYDEDETVALCDIRRPSEAGSIRRLLYRPEWTPNHDVIESGEVLRLCWCKSICRREAHHVEQSYLHRLGRFYSYRTERLGANQSFRVEQGGTHHDDSESNGCATSGMETASISKTMYTPGPGVGM